MRTFVVKRLLRKLKRTKTKETEDSSETLSSSSLNEAYIFNIKVLPLLVLQAVLDD